MFRINHKEPQSIPIETASTVWYKCLPRLEEESKFPILLSTSGDGGETSGDVPPGESGMRTRRTER